MEKEHQSGQVLVEYVLLIFLVLMMTSLIGVSLRSTIFKLWKGYTKEIIAPCPGCKPPETNFKN